MPKPFNELDRQLQIFIRAYRAANRKLPAGGAAPTGSRFRVSLAPWGGSYGKDDGLCLMDLDEGLSYFVSHDEMKQQGHELTKGESLKLSRFHFEVETALLET